MLNKVGFQAQALCIIECLTAPLILWKKKKKWYSSTQIYKWLGLDSNFLLSLRLSYWVVTTRKHKQWWTFCGSLTHAAVEKIYSALKEGSTPLPSQYMNQWKISTLVIMKYTSDIVHKAHLQGRQHGCNWLSKTRFRYRLIKT